MLRFVRASKKGGEDASRTKEAARDSHEDKVGQKKIIKEIGGPKGKEPTRYGDWERKGRCIDF